MTMNVRGFQFVFCHILIVSMLGFTGLAAISVLAGHAFAETDEQQSKDGDGAEKFKTETVRGHFVWMAEAQERLYGVRSVPESKERVLAFETADGELVALAEDVRGRAFRVDQRLRDLK